MNIPCPNVKWDPFLALDTLNDEITVWFDAYQAHFDGVRKNDADEGALVLVQKIISDKYIVVSFG